MTQTEEQKRNLNKLADKYIEHLCGEVKCWKCTHYLGNGKCKAFPSGDGIPIEIMYRGFDHTKEYPGDNGIRFKEK